MASELFAESVHDMYVMLAEKKEAVRRFESEDKYSPRAHKIVKRPASDPLGALRRGTLPPIHSE